jgi:hydrogenase-4 membrane subunit HyfE
MSPLMAALLGAILIPLFIASWRVSLLGLSCQGLLMAWMALRKDPDPISVNGFLTLVDLALIRGIGLPIALYCVLRSQNAPYRINVISANLLLWTLSLGIVLLAFNFSGLLADGQSETRYVVAFVAAGVMLGLQILATPSAGIFSQVIGVLYIENAIAFSEQGSDAGPEPIAVRLSLIFVVAMTFLLYRWYLMTVHSETPVEMPEALEGPTL